MLNLPTKQGKMKIRQNEGNSKVEVTIDMEKLVDEFCVDEISIEDVDKVHDVKCMQQVRDNIREDNTDDVEGTEINAIIEIAKLNLLMKVIMKEFQDCIKEIIDKYVKINQFSRTVKVHK